jgi:hypothetical protein
VASQPATDPGPGRRLGAAPPPDRGCVLPGGEPALAPPPHPGTCRRAGRHHTLHNVQIGRAADPPTRVHTVTLSSAYSA